MPDAARPGRTWRLPDSLAEDIEDLGRMARQVQDGTLSPERFRAFRVPMGVYEQRERGQFMLRVRIPAGGVLPHQMRVLADVARRYGNGRLHVTTRQDIQVHRVPLESVYPAETALYQAGLATKGGGGNTVRNVTACPHAGVCPHEVFDVAPHAVAATEFLLPDPLSYQLPRKYKLAFSGCAADCAGATVNDLGLIAKERDGRQGFAVHVGGGMGARSRVADPLEDFVPAPDVPLVAEAVKRVFDQHGNRKNKHKARLRFLIDRIGLEAFRKLYQKELAALRADPPECPQAHPLPRAERPAPEPAGQPQDGFETWQQANVIPQKQDRYTLARIPLELGDIQADTLEALADVVEAHGEGMLRTTQTQDAVLRWVHEHELPDVHRKLAGLGLASTPAPLLRTLIACTGAATCRLGIGLSRGLATAIRRELTRDGLDLARLGDLRIHINGCPNACGREPIAQLGFFGAARRIEGRLVPHYVLQLGGRVGEGRTRLAEGKTALPARRIPAFVRELLTAFAESDHCPDFDAFLDSGGRALAKDIAAKHRDVPPFEEDKNFYFDWGSDELFSLAGRGPGECSAGVFDLIEVDLTSAREALDAGRLHVAVSLAARALLVTRGEEPRDDHQALQLFQRHFLEQGLVEARFAPLVTTALECTTEANPDAAFEAEPEDAADLVAAVQTLYDTMDDSLRFQSPAADDVATEAPAEDAQTDDLPEPDLRKDFRGVACPLNYAKTKMALEELKAGQVLAVLLDDEGANNCPLSAQADGHEVIAVTEEDDHWRLLLRKGNDP
jgi:sulfite reductase (ferredoxin)